MTLKRNNAIIFSILSTVLNVFMANIIGGLSIPALQLNSLGTIFTSVVYGPWFGALTGLFTGVIQGVNKDFKIIPLILANMAIGLIVGFISKKKRFTYYNSLVIGLITGIVAGIVIILSNPFSYINIISLISNNIVDKVASCLIVAIVGNILARGFFKGKI